ncbi:MAG: RDD family protein [Spirochaetaceae bacterium]|jgi:uncharacterized RDD family membrane protein YckC|nr:RDD family protein [Spirochaetaceae bacterium]
MTKPLDTTISALTPEGIEYTLYPAGLAARGTAYALDIAVQWTLIISAALIFSTFLFDAIGFWFILLLMFVVEWFYQTLCDILFQGQSLGKRIIGIRVVQSDGSPVEGGASFLRNLLRFADTFLMLYHIAVLSISLSGGFRRIGDFAANTLVVYTANARFVLQKNCLSQTSICAISPPRPLSLIEKQTLITFAGRYSLLGRNRADEIVKPWTSALGWQPFATASPATSPSEYVLGLAKNWTGEA